MFEEKIFLMTQRLEGFKIFPDVTSVLQGTALLSPFPLPRFL